MVPRGLGSSCGVEPERQPEIFLPSAQRRQLPACTSPTFSLRETIMRTLKLTNGALVPWHAIGRLDPQPGGPDAAVSCVVYGLTGDRLGETIEGWKFGREDTVVPAAPGWTVHHWSVDLDDHFKIWTLGSVIAWRIGSGDSRPTPILVWGDLGSQPYLIQSPTGEVVRHRAGCCPDAPWLMHYPDITAATQSLIFDWQAARAEQRLAEARTAAHA